MKRYSFLKAMTSLAATALIAAAMVPASAGAAWKKVCTLGDLNNDSQVNVADIVVLSKNLHGTAKLDDKSIYRVSDSQKYSVEYGSGSRRDALINNGTIQKADLNFDGSVDIHDLVELRKSVLNSNYRGDVVQCLDFKHVPHTPS